MISYNFLKKLTIPNILNGLAMRLYRLTNYLSSNMIMLAIKLNPSRQVFKNNLQHFKNFEFDRIEGISYDYYNIEEYSQKNDIKIKFFENNRNLNLTSPKVINPEIGILKEFICNGVLPKIYLAEFDNATIMANNDLILYNNTCLYDEVEHGKSYNYAIKAFHTIKKID